MPALNALWNAHDVDVGHKRRYTKQSLRDKLEFCGFEVIFMKYFFISITPLLLLRKFLNPAKKDQIPQGDKIPRINFTLNQILLFITTLENTLIPHLPDVLNPFGGSLFAIAKKKRNLV